MRFARDPASLETGGEKVKHYRSSLLVGGYSELCRAGLPVKIASPSKRCLVPIPDGVNEAVLDLDRIDLCADCPVARRANVGHAVITPVVGNPVEPNDLER
ncbi:MAG: hypothetical protein FWD62_05360 [Betaproteobacteria bacterium]|nr:hypothetical protein [Betaproteobacteria bacterium]